MQRRDLLFWTTLIGVLLSVVGSAAVSSAPREQRGPGSCGEYMYWHDGKCVDARAKPSGKSWMQSIF
jgi:hypothetical protein